jgi:hypothetical protein
MSGDEQKLNPQIKEVYIGTRDLRKVTIYPLSISDQKRFGAIMQKALEEYFARTTDKEELTQEDMLSFIVDIKGVVSENLLEILKIISDLREKDIAKFFEEATNLQVSEIVSHVVEVNFEEPLKNLQSLFEKGMTLYEQFQSRRQLQQFSNDTASILSPTFTGKVTEKEASPLDS